MFFSKRLVILKAVLAMRLFASLSALANPEVEKLVLEYKRAMNSHNKKRIRELVTDDYYQSLTQNDLLDRLFKQTPNQTSKKKKTYKVEVVESKVVEGAIMASAAEKGSDHGHKDWYKIKKKGEKYLIDQEVHLD